MDGANHIIKGMRKHQIVMPAGQIGLQPEFHTDHQIDPILISFLQWSHIVKIFFRVKFKADTAVCVIIVHVVGQTQMGKSE